MKDAGSRSNGPIIDADDGVGAMAGDGPIPQPHGGALLPRSPASGMPASGIPAGGPAAGRTSLRAAKRRCRDLLVEADERGTERLIKLYDSADERVAVVAINAGKDRLYGKVGDAGIYPDDEGGALDLTHLPPEGQAECWAAIMTLKKWTGGE